VHTYSFVTTDPNLDKQGFVTPKDDSKPQFTTG